MNNPYLYSINKTRYKHETHHLKTHQVAKLFKAAELAYYHKAPLNRFFTIHCHDYVDRKHPQKFILKLLEHARKWLHKRNIPVAYIYTLENAKIKGIHVHLLIHIPAGEQIEFKKALRRWLPFEWDKRLIDVKRTQYPPYGSLNALNPIYGRLQYICKAIDPAQSMFGIAPKYQGAIMGQRYGMSKMLRDLVKVRMSKKNETGVFDSYGLCELFLGVSAPCAA